MQARHTVIVLATAESTRLPALQARLSEPMGRGTVLEMTLAHAMASQLQLLVVAAAELADGVRQHVATRELLVLPRCEAEAGVGRAIAAAVCACSDAAGWVILPADRPMIRPSTLCALALALQQYPVAWAQHRGLRGQPVGFAAELYSDLIRLEGSEDARRLASRYPAHELEVEDDGVLHELETAAGMARARARCAERRGLPLLAS